MMKIVGRGSRAAASSEQEVHHFDFRIKLPKSAGIAPKK
jgi:hypothetical protein